MADIYATPEADLSQDIELDRAGGNIDDAVTGNFQVGMLQTLGEAWRGLKGFKLKCCIALIIYMVVFLGLAMLLGALAAGLVATGADESVSGVLSMVLQIVVNLVMLPIGVSIMVMAMRHANGKPVSAGEIFRHFDVTLGLFLVYIFLTIVMVILGIGTALIGSLLGNGLLFAVPVAALVGIYLMFAYTYAMPLVLEKKMGFWHALETSRRAITHVWFRFFGFLCLVTLINAIPLILPGILMALLGSALGLVSLLALVAWVWTVPWAILAMSMVYQKIFGVEAHTLADQG